MPDRKTTRTLRVCRDGRIVIGKGRWERQVGVIAHEVGMPPPAWRAEVDGKGIIGWHYKRRDAIQQAQIELSHVL